MNPIKHTFDRKSRDNLKKPRVLITGGGGFIGSHLTRRLVHNGYAVTIIDNLSRGRLSNVNDCLNAVRFLRGDIRSRVLIAKAMSNVEVVFHLAAQSQVLQASTNIDECMRTNVAGTTCVLEAARAAGVRRIVFTSSREVYGESAKFPVSETDPLRPKNPYGMSKVAGEMCCAMAREHGLEITVLRIANAYGRGDRDRVVPNFLANALSGLPLIIHGGDQVLDFVPVEFVIESLVRSGFGPYVPGPLNIGSGTGTTVLELAERILTMSRSPSRMEVRQKRDIEVSRFIASIDATARLLGLRLETEPLAGLQNLMPLPETRWAQAAGAFQAHSSA